MTLSFGVQPERRPTSFSAPRADGHRVVHVIQGEFHVSDEEDVVLTTVLGSCVAACLRDPVSRIGGINHFLLPGDEGQSGKAELRYGVHAMELLVNDILRRGGRRDRLTAKLFGGARLDPHLPDIGARNAAFAEEFLRQEGIVYQGGSLGGVSARRIRFFPHSGRAQQATVQQVKEKPFVPAPSVGGDVELF